MENDEQQYREHHHVFSELGRYINFYESLGSAILGFCTTGVTAILLNFNSYVYTSMQGTLSSIRSILKDARINDAYALLRKYHDSVIINIYSNLYLEDHCNIDHFIVEKIDNWLKGKERLPEYRVMSSYIKSSDTVAAITVLLDADNRYKRIRDCCNDHTHYNFFYNVLLNGNEFHLTNHSQVLDVFSADVRDIFILHVSYLFFLKEYYMSSSDYMDALECGVTPAFDSQYWVAPFIQVVFDDIIARERPDIAATIKQYTCMHLS